MLTDAEWEAIGLSLKVAVACVLVVAVPATLAGCLLARGRFRGKALVDALVHLPLVLPPVVVGYVLLVSFGRNGWIGRSLYDWTGWSLAFTWQAAAVASAVMAFPLMVRSVRLSVETIDVRLETAARSLGATRFDVFRSVTLPLAMPGVLAGMLLAFARSLGEFGATITFAGNVAGETRTLPLALYSMIQTPEGEAAALRLVGLSILLSVGALLASEAWTRQVHRKLKGSP